MRNRDVSFLAVRLLSLYLFIQMLQGFTTMVGMMPLTGLISEAPHMILISFLPFLFYAAIAAALWRFSGRISEYISAGSDNTVDNQNTISTDSLQALAFSVIGVLVFVKALPSFIAMLPHIKMAIEISDNSPAMLSGIVESGISVILGVGLFVGSKVLTKLYKKIAATGLNDELTKES